MRLQSKTKIVKKLQRQQLNEPKEQGILFPRLDLAA